MDKTVVCFLAFYLSKKILKGLARDEPQYFLVAVVAGVGLEPTKACARGS